jgi:hypothetical protein
MRTTFDDVVKASDVRGRFRRLIGACTGGGLLLTRYHIFDNRWFGVYLHRLNQSDEERAPHDHPWSFISVLLTGGYTEVTPVFCSVNGGCTPAEDKRWYHQLSVLFRPAEYIHRLELTKPTWTLVLRGPERRTWGFWVVNPTNMTREWMDHREYGEKFCE